MDNNTRLFSKTILIKGKHCEYTKALVNKIDTQLPGLFKRNLDVYLIAPIIGKLYNRKAEEDPGEDTKVFLEQLNGEYDRLMFNYRLIVLLEDKGSVEFEERCNRAFRYDKDAEKRAYGDKIFNQYVLGGIEVLYEKLIEGVTDKDDYANNMYEFINNYNDLYMSGIDRQELLELCKLAGK